jgi:hypothetical protein
MRLVRERHVRAGPSCSVHVDCGYIAGTELAKVGGRGEPTYSRSHPLRKIPAPNLSLMHPPLDHRSFDP